MTQLSHKKFLHIISFSAVGSCLPTKLFSGKSSTVSETLGKYELLDDMLLDTYQREHAALLPRAYMTYFRETYQVFGEDSFGWGKWTLAGVKVRSEQHGSGNQSS